MNDKRDSIEILNIQVLRQNLDELKASLDTACRSGLYSLSEVETLLVSLQNMRRALTTLNDYQEYVKELSKNGSNSSEPNNEEELV